MTTTHEASGNSVGIRSSTRPNDLRGIAKSIEPLFPDAADMLRGIARELAAGLPCEITADRWCATHSTGDGPVYCEGRIGVRTYRSSLMG
jgi:hypothetical protein